MPAQGMRTTLAVFRRIPRAFPSLIHRLSCLTPSCVSPAARFPLAFHPSRSPVQLAKMIRIAPFRSLDGQCECTAPTTRRVVQCCGARSRGARGGGGGRCACSRRRLGRVDTAAAPGAAHAARAVCARGMLAAASAGVCVRGGISCFVGTLGLLDWDLSAPAAGVRRRAAASAARVRAGPATAAVQQRGSLLLTVPLVPPCRLRVPDRHPRLLRRPRRLHGVPRHDRHRLP